MSLSPDAFVEGLVVAVPEVQAVVDEHFRDNGELLLHLLMGDIARFEYGAFRERRTNILERLLGYLDCGLQEGDSEVDNAVCLSFVENVNPSAPGQRAFIDTWPSALRAEAERQAGGHQ